MHILKRLFGRNRFFERTRLNGRKITLGICLILAGASAVFLIADTYIRNMIRGYPISIATGLMQNLMDEAMSNTLSGTNGFNPSKIDNVIYGDDKTVLSVETDTSSLNKIKTAYAENLKKIFQKYGNKLNVSVPIGTLIGNEYTLGRGPNVKFQVQFSTTTTSKLSGTFSEAGINNTKHTIMLDVSTEIFILIPWGNVSKSVNTNYILAETLIFGKVPEAYTNVYDGAGDVVDDLFNYGAQKNK